MKVRIQGNSLRFRLKQFEVEAFAIHHSIKEEVVFGPSMRLQFILSAAAVADMQVDYQPGKVTVSLPQTMVEEWTGTTLVGFHDTITMASGEVINILIEKDFKCLDGAEEEIGSYPNPKEAC